MRKRQWQCQREAIPTRDAQRRWDQAYQYLVLWSQPSEEGLLQGQLLSEQEEDDENRPVCACVYAPASSDAND